MADVVNLGNIQIANAVSVVYTAGDNITISDDRVISAIVPTKTSDLLNDSGYITNETDGLVNYTTTSELNTLLSEKADSDDVYTKTESDSRYPLSSNVYSKTESDSKYSTIPETGNKIEVSINSSTYVMTMNLKDKNNNILSTGTVDLPLESVVVSGRYDDTTKELILTLQNGNEIKISVADLVSGLQETLIAGDNIQINGNTISATDTTYSAGENVTITGTTISAKDTTYELSGETEDDVTTITLTDSDDNTSTATVDMTKYQEELDTLNEIVDGLPHVEGEGTELSLSPTIKASLKSTLKGNAGQFTTTGKNIFSGYVLGVRLDPTTGAESADLSNKSATSNYISAQVSSGNYTISGLPTTIRTFVAAYNSSKQFLGRTGAGSVASLSLTSSSFTGGTPAGSGDIEYLRVTSYEHTDSTGTIADAMNAKVQLESGSTATSYEPYTGGVASPNPEYPQKVKVVTGDNTIQVCGKNLFSGYTKGSRLSPTDGSEYSSATGAVSDYIPVDMSNSAKYVVSGLLNTLFTFVGAYNQNKEFLGRTDANNPSSRSLTSTSFNNGSPTATGEIKYIRITAYENPNVTGKIDDIDNAQTMVEEGSTATTYEPYTGQLYPINLGVVNLYNDYRTTTQNSAGITVSQDSDGVKLNGIYDKSKNTNYWLSQSTDTAYNNLVLLKANTTYTVKVDLANGTISSTDYNCTLSTRTADNDKTFTWNYLIIPPANGSWTNTFTVGSSDIYLAGVRLTLNTTNTVTFTNAVMHIQIEEGTMANSYSPYGVAPVELCKIGNYQDYFVKQNDKWYKSSVIKKVVLDGTEGWVVNSYGENYYRFVATFSDAITVSNSNTEQLVYCDYFYGSSARDTITPTPDKNMLAVISTNRLLFNTIDTDLFGGSVFTSWLSTNKPSVRYVLATPTITEITNQTLIDQLNAIASASSYKTQTNIYSVYNTDNAQMIISASALYDLGALINA